MIKRLLTGIATMGVALSCMTQDKYYIYQGKNAYEFDVDRTDSISFDAPEIETMSLGKGMLMMQKGEALALDFGSTPGYLLQDVKWTSSNESVVKVVNGAVFANGVGSAVITGEIGELRAIRTVIVKGNTEKATSLQINKERLEMSQFDVEQLLAMVEPSGADKGEIVWETSDASVASVLSGVVVAKGAGEAVVTAKMGGMSASCVVSVNVPVTGIVADSSAVQLYLGGSEEFPSEMALEKLGVKAVPSTASAQTIEYMSSAPSIVAIEDGKLVAKSPGTVQVTAFTGSHSVKIRVTVTVPVTDLTIAKESIVMEEGESMSVSELGVQVLPIDAEQYADIKWSAASPIVSINGGVITANFTGVTVITASCLGHKVSAEVTVLKEAKEIKVDAENVRMELGEKKSLVSLGAVVVPSGATDEMTYTSSDTDVIEIVDGYMVAKSVGYATLTVSAGNAKKNIAVSVDVTLRGIELARKELTIDGTSNGVSVSALGVRAVPENAKLGEIAWGSSNENVATIETANGVSRIIPTGAGMCVVRAIVSGFSSEAIVTVKYEAGMLKIDSEIASMIKGDVYNTGEWKYSVNPAEAAEGKKVLWTTSNPAVITINNASGVVKAVGVGGTWVYATMDAAKDSVYVTVSQPVRSISLAQKEIELSTDGGAVSLDKMVAAVLPEDAEYDRVEWTSSNAAIAEVKTVMGKTVVSPVKGGETTLTVTIGGVSAEVRVVVKQSVESIKIKDSVIKIDRGQQISTNDIVVAINPASATDADIKWVVRDESIATLGATGTITAKKKGETYLVAECEGKLDSVLLQVVVPVTDFTIEKDSYTLYKWGAGVNVKEFGALVTPVDASNSAIVWKSEDENIAKVATLFGNTMIMPVNGGKTVVDAIVGDIVLKVDITVLVKPEGIDIVEKSINVEKGETFDLTTLNVKVEPEDVSEYTLDWSCKENGVATVSGDGVLSAKKGGKMYAVASVGEFKDSVLVNVSAKAEKIVISNPVINMTLGAMGVNIESCGIEVLPEDATNKQIEWSSSDEEILEITTLVSKHTLSAKKGGDVVLTGKVGDAEAEINVHISVPTLGIEIAEDAVEIKLGGDAVEVSRLFNVSVLPEDASDKTIEWVSLNEDIVRITQVPPSNIYMVEAVNGGTATILAKQGEKRDEVLVKVFVATDGIEVERDYLEIALDGSVPVSEFGAKIVPANSTERQIKWESADANIASVRTIAKVDRVLAKGVGETTLTASCGELKKDVRVKVYKALKSVTMMDKIELPLGKNVSLDTLEIKFVPEDAEYKELTWTSSDKDVVYVENGEIVPVGKGNATLTATNKEGVMASVDVRIVESLNGINIKNPEIEVAVNSSYAISDLGISFVPETADYTALVWSTSDKSIAVVDGDNIVTKEEAGEAELVGTTAEGKEVKVKVTVIVPLESISAKNSDIRIVKGGEYETEKLGIEFNPFEATKTSLVWETSDATVAEMNAEGTKILAKGDGKAVLTATSPEGKTLDITVTVYTPLEKVETDVALIEIASNKEHVYDLAKLNLKFTPEDATDKKIVWSIDDTNVATVDNDANTITAVAEEGEAVLHGETSEGIVVEVPVRVIVAVEEIKIGCGDINGMMLTQYFDKGYLKVEVIPTNATNRDKVTYSISNDVLKYADGKFSAENGGVAEVYAECDGVKSDVIKVSVSDRITYTNKNNIQFTMIIVQGGTYLMGAQSEDPNKPNYDADAAANEGPVHEVTVGDFMIGETEVTVELFNSYSTQFSKRDLYGGYSGNEKKNPAQCFSSMEGSVGKMNGFFVGLNKDDKVQIQFCLPTEEQWEYAARGGKYHSDYKYSGSNSIDEVARYGQSKSYTQDVAKLAPNKLGIYDMSGNVWEKCSSRELTTYPSEHVDALECSNAIYGKVSRGGGSKEKANRCTVTARTDVSYLDGTISMSEGHQLGLRLVAPIPFEKEYK